MDKLKSLSFYLLANIIPFYILPLIIHDKAFVVFTLMLFFPLLCVIESFMYGSKYGFNILYPIAVAVLFIPTVFIYFNSSAFIYTIIYGVLCLVGNFFGYKSIK